MKRVNLTVVGALLIISNCCTAQSPTAKFESFPNVSPFPKSDPDKWQQLRQDFTLSAADFDSRLSYNKYPVTNGSSNISVSGWKGERVNCLLVVSSKKDINLVKTTVSDLKADNGATIGANSCNIGYVYYVVGDNSRGICHKKDIKYDDIIVPDVIDFNGGSSFVKPFTNRPIWISFTIPQSASPGSYKGKITVSLDGRPFTSNILVKVLNRTMPPPVDRKFFLDLWQYPLTEAEYYKVKPWSDQHFNLMKRSMIQLKDAGQKVITTSFFWDMFNSTPRKAEDMMIKVIKKKDGQWDYDFDNFDRWVQFMMSLGIKDQITCYGLAPLNYRYHYFDEGTGQLAYFSQGVNGADYRKFWTPYLQAFEKHLKEKGWFEITTLGIDEKELSVLTVLIDFIKSQDKDWKISVTGKYFPQIQDNVYHYAVISNQQVPDADLAGRKAKGYITTFYTSCWELFPNTFVMSDPIDATWLSWNAANRSLDGYSRWAYDYWSMGKNALVDVRSTLSAGDNFIIYPSGYSSIRFEMLKDGIEDYEKIYQKSGNSGAAPAGSVARQVRTLAAPVGQSDQLKKSLSDFDFKKVSANRSRGLQVREARAMLDN